MNGIGIILVLFFVLIGSTLYFVYQNFQKLRIQNVKVFEALFLSFIYSVVYCWSKFVSKEELEVSKENIWKLFWPNFILIFGITCIIFTSIIYVKTHLP